MEPIYLKHLSNNEPIIGLGDDNNAPLSYLEWKGRLPSLIERDAMERYNEYVVGWFQKNKTKPVSQKFLLRQKYLYMLDKLQLFFDTDEKNKWYRQVNLADEKELLLAIPYFAKKLKDISLYYLSLRKKLKKTKVRYNHVGSVAGLKQEIQNFLLETFSGKNNELSPSLQSTVPSFSALSNELSIEIEELYDDKQYFDLSLNKPLSGYFNLLNEATSKFLLTKGITLSSADWLFRSYNIPTSIDNFTTLFSEMTGTLFEMTDRETYGSFVEKYIAEPKGAIEFTPQLSSTSTFNLQIDAGNNNFFYPYGKTDSTYSVNKQIPLVALSSVVIDTATAGTDITTSDTIIVKYGNVTKAAWYRSVPYKLEHKNISAIIKKDTSTRFIYPFAGYGLSGVNVEWTGPSFETNKEYNFLSVDLKASVDQTYWSQDLPLDSCNSVLLNNTTLISSGSTPSVNPQFADHFYIRTDRNTDNTMPYGEVQGAWLYKFTRTSLPVSTSQENILLWPYIRISSTEEYPAYLNEINFIKACNPVYVTSLNKAYFTAGNDITKSDRIYKMSNAQDSLESALECAWLSGSSVSLASYPKQERQQNDALQSGINLLNAGGVNGLKFIQQDGFSSFFPAGEVIKFIWTGPSQTRLEDVFTNPQHRRDCLFSTNSSSVSAFDWHKCTCKQVYHAPFGHSFNSFEEGNYLADCIVEVPEANLDTFDFASWKSTTGSSILSSLQFAWYRTKTNFTWGNGEWRSNVLLGNAPFTLWKGKTYIYKRANNKNLLPGYSVKFNYFTDNTKWITAKKEGTEWVTASGNPVSNMVFYPGDIIRVEKQGFTTSYFLSAIYAENISVNQNNQWSTYDVIPINCSTANSTRIRWPINPPPWGSTDKQYPVTTFSSLSYIKAWSITHDETHETHFAEYEEIATFVAPMEGTYSIAVTAVKQNGDVICIPPNPYLGTIVQNLSTVTYTQQMSANGLAFANARDYYRGKGVSWVLDYDYNVVRFTFWLGADTYFSNTEINTVIPKLSAVPQYQKTKLIEVAIETPTSGFLIEQSLKGWNYNSSRVDSNAFGARPYWATIDTQKTSTTRYKGIYSWGYLDEYIDDYLPNYNPVVSPLKIDYGTIIEYDRKGYPFTWNQPIAYQEYVNTKQWCSLSADLTHASNLSAIYRIKQNIEPIVIPSNTPSDILLSNKVDGAPLQVFYYALNSFTWPIEFITVQDTLTPTPSALFNSAAPWNNVLNRFNPTIANVPVIEETYSAKDVGGYFLPQRLGASQFVNKDFDIFTKDETPLGLYLVESVDSHVGGRGITQLDNSTIFDWTENNQWLKESVTTGNLAGAPKKSLTKNYQTFIPYQSNTEETVLGLVTPRSRFSPWGGPSGDEWVDKNNEPVGFTGVRNVSAWAASQVLKQNEKSIDNWSSDIYGNQYGLFKELDGVNLIDYSKVFGELWVRTNSQNVIPATIALSAVYSPFKGLTGIDVYTELTENKIQIFNCYFDTLFIKTPSIVLYPKITYNYESSQIEMVFDDVRWKELNPLFNFNKNWFISTEKKLYNLFTKTEGGYFYPCIYELSLSNRDYKKVFDSFDNAEHQAPTKFASITNVCFSYNSLLDTFLITYSGFNELNKLFLVDYYVKRNTPFVLTKIDVYEDTFNFESITEPPIPLPQYLSAINVGLDTFSVFVSAINNPTSFELLNYTNDVTVKMISGYGVFTGQLSSAGLHHVNYRTKNEIGDSIYSLTLLAQSMSLTYLTISITPETGSSLANNNNGVLYIQCYKPSLLDTNIQIAGGNLNTPVSYAVASGQTISLSGLESSNYEIYVYDEYVGMKTVKAFVGFAGQAGFFVSAPSSLTNYQLNTQFQI